MAKKNEEKSDITTLFDKINKQYGSGTLKSATDAIDAERISTGSIVLDQLTKGGVPRGFITHIYGSEGAGKTTLALRIAKEAQKIGLGVMYIDVEQTVRASYLDSLGINTDIDKFVLSSASLGEDVIQIVREVSESGLFGLIIVDSVAAMTSKMELDGSFGDAIMGVKARLMSQMARVLPKIINDNNVALIFINQMRDSIGPYGGKPIPGGRGLKYSSALALELIRIKKTPDHIVVKTTVEKNKFGKSFDSAEIQVFFGRGTDIYYELVELGEEHKLWTKGGAWYTYGEQKFQGADKLVEYLRTLSEDELDILIDKCKQ